MLIAMSMSPTLPPYYIVEGRMTGKKSAHVPCRCRFSLNSFSAWLIESANVEPVNTQGWLHWATQSWCKWLYIININLLLFPAMPVGFILLTNCPVASPIGQYISWNGSRRGQASGLFCSTMATNVAQHICMIDDYVSFNHYENL